MFCSKCGLQNADETKFCRGCGSDLNELAVVATARGSESQSLDEKYIALNSRGVRGVLIGLGFFVIAGVVFTTTLNAINFGLFLLMFGMFFLATGISRFYEAKGIKRLNKGSSPTALPISQTDYLKPARSLYETDSLLSQPRSVTENTTRHLRAGDE